MSMCKPIKEVNGSFTLFDTTYTFMDMDYINSDISFQFLVFLVFFFKFDFKYFLSTCLLFIFLFHAAWLTYIPFIFKFHFRFQFLCSHISFVSSSNAGL